MSTPDTVTRLLDTADRLVRDRGYSAFSYKDLAESVGIRTASIHYHFQAKADLGQAVVDRYREQLVTDLAKIDDTAKSAREKLEYFIAAYRETESRGTICLCGSLASDYETLPEKVQDSVRRYLAEAQKWLKRTLKEGAKNGEFELVGKPTDLAVGLLSALQGGLVLSRAQGGEENVLERVERGFFANLSR